MGFEPLSSVADFASALQASLVYASLIVLLGVVLSVPVMLRRRAAKIGLGDGGDKELLRRMRIHGNFIEQATLGLPVLLMLPFAGAPVWICHAMGASLLISRMFHAQGLSQSFGVSFGRTIGMALSWTVLVGGALLVIIYALTGGTALRILLPA
jgi:uncharacterized protein